MDQESLAQIQQIVGAATETLRTEIVDAKRHTGVLTEGLRHELQLVAEGFQMHLDRRHVDDRAHLDEQFRETRGCINRPSSI
jgi:hypothetical protein